MRAFLVRMPSGLRYWTVVDDDFHVVEHADLFLREARLSRGRAELTTKAYAEAVVLYLWWCLLTGRDWKTAAQHLGLFIVWLRWTPGPGTERTAVRRGPGSKPVRENKQVNKVLTAVRGLLSHAVSRKAAPAWVLDQLYELGSEADLPAAARGKSDTMRVRLRARHRLDEPESEIDRASDEEVVAMFLQCRIAAVSRASLQTDLANALDRNRRLTAGSVNWNSACPPSSAKPSGPSPASAPLLTSITSSDRSSGWSRSSPTRLTSWNNAPRNLKRHEPPTVS
ncbi:hypothetical protein ACGF5O_44770 [Streptomyces sp. NPDC048291]|uniref:hypothetical protein n=1 Tax=unclassified Streptomyces TaxID=2593676 RepID=UPI0034371B5B